MRNLHADIHIPDGTDGLEESSSIIESCAVGGMPYDKLPQQAVLQTDITKWIAKV